MIEKYSKERASQYIGKKILVSIKHISSNGDENYEAFFGTIDSVSDGGYLLKLEGNRAGDEWCIPPCLDAFEEPEHKVYKLDGNDENS